MSLDQLRSFVAVVEEGTVVGAAGRLHISQPPLTRRIHALEAELGAPLFERVHRGMRPTAAGLALLPHARQILATVRAAERSVKDQLRPPESVPERNRVQCP